MVLDRVIYEDAEIFARNLFEIGNMEERDYKNYVALYEVMTEYLHPPDLLIYLRANVDTLSGRLPRAAGISNSPSAGNTWNS